MTVGETGRAGTGRETLSDVGTGTVEPLALSDAGTGTVEPRFVAGLVEPGSLIAASNCQ